MCKTPPKIFEAINFKHYKTFEFKRDLSIAPSNALWKQFRDKFNQITDLDIPIRRRRVTSKYTHPS